MLGVLVILVWISCVGLVSGTWYFTENKICDPSGTNQLPFSGFKINRQYKIAGLLHPVSMHFLVLTHCDHGIVDYQKHIRTQSSSGVDWDRPFCLFKPKLGDMMTLKPEDTIANLVDNDIEVTQMIDTTNEGTSGIKSVVLNKVVGLRNLVRHVFDKTVESLTSGKSIQYTGNKSRQHYEDIIQSDPQSVMEWEARNFVCYKMARRRKYAKQKLSFYVPETFVGGLFECSISAEQKKQIFQSFSPTDFLKSVDLKCEPSLSKPISPLIAADSTQQWISNKLFNIFNPALTQTIPYLSTASPLNVRFSTSNTPDMYKDTWATKIEVNEDYDYSEADIHLISKAISTTANYLNKLLSPIDFNGLLRNHLNWADESENPSLTSHDSLISKFESVLSLDQKSNLFLSYGKSGLVHLQNLQKLWEITSLST
ncbi:uncharacterized protein RJT21DRAFT_133064 [Scheffersomyces amazonensis]|uniref:uncharacterized protein n=1 Tax=Scheffersomyces amazonensis TaxID=1078765 RepID=UPI00315C88BC